MMKVDWKDKLKNTEFKVRNFIGENSTLVDENEGASRSVHKHSPRDGSLLYTFGSGTKNDVNRAVKFARASFEAGHWNNQPLRARMAVLDRLAELVLANREEFALYECMDVGKPIADALDVDVAGAAKLLRNVGEAALRLRSPCAVDGTTFAYQLRKPVGVVGAIIGWNFPLSLAIGKIAPALIMGNSLVLKPSEYTSLSAWRLAQLALEAGLPPGVLNVVNGLGETAGAALAYHPDVDLLSFTGSTMTGKKMMIAAGQSNMKRLMLECGGKSPYLVFDDCPEDLDAIAADVVARAFPNQGALCVAGSRLLVQSSIKDRFVDLVIKHTKQITPADPLNPDTKFGAIMNEAHLEKVLGFVEGAKRDSAHCLYGGERIRVNTPDGDGGYYMTPAVFDNVNTNHSIAQEEIFGPVLSVFSFAEEGEALGLANGTKYGLAARVATTNLARTHRLVQNLDAGIVSIHGVSGPSTGGVSIGAEGQKESGFGFEGGLEGLPSYSVSTAASIYI